MPSIKIITVILLIFAVTGLIAFPGCNDIWDHSFKLMSRTLPSLGRVLEGTLCNRIAGELPAIMRVSFDGCLGWITFEERYQDTIYANYRLEMPGETFSVPGEYGRVENPKSQSQIGSSVFGMMKLTREGSSLVGSFEQQSDKNEKGELVLKFSRNMQSFTGKWRKEGDSAWNESLTGSAR
jgi:hypothetical protein